MPASRLRSDTSWRFSYMKPAKANMYMTSAVHIIIIVLALLVGLSWQENRFSLPPSGCICPRSELTFECSIKSPGATIWRASFINDCFGSGEIALIHNDRFNQNQTCNDGAITAKALGVNNNTYTSQLIINVTMASLLNGSTVTCGYDDYIKNKTVTVGTWMMIDHPMNLHLEGADEAHLNFGWNSVDPSCPSLHYIVHSTNCGTCPMRVNSTAVVCDEFNVTADFQVCSIAIQRMCGDYITGIMSDILQVILKVPEPPLFAHSSPYYWIKNENTLMLNVTLNKLVVFKISDAIDGSPTSYTIQYSDSRATSSAGCNDSETIPASSCRGSICNYVFEIANSSCSPDDIIVTAFATNVFGDGPHSSAGTLRLGTSMPQKIYHDILGTHGILEGVTAFAISIAIVVITTVVVYCCYTSRQHDKDNLHVIEFYVKDEPGSLAKALQIFVYFKISVHFVHALSSTSHGQDERGFCVSYHCSSRKNEKVMRRLTKTIGKKENVITNSEIKKRNDHSCHIIVNFSVNDDFGNIASVTKLLGELNASIVDLKSGKCSDNKRKFTIECMCSIHAKMMLTEILTIHGAINPTIDSDEVFLPPLADNNERTVVKFRSANAVGSYHGVIRSLSEIQKFSEEYKLYHVKMSTDGVYLTCSYPRGQREQLKRDIEVALNIEVQLIHPPDQVPERAQLQNNA